MAARFPARLNPLSRDDLLKLAIAGCAVSDAVRSAADALLARKQPLPAWCVEGVLRSPDLLPHMMEQLALQDNAAAAVCSAWAAQWAALLRRRRYVRPAVERTLQLLVEPDALAAMPDGRLCVGGDQGIAFVSPETCEHGMDVTAHGHPHGLLQHEGAMFVSLSRSVVKVSNDGLQIAQQLEGMNPYGLALHGGRLFVANEEKVAVLDAESLEVVHSIRTTAQTVRGRALDLQLAYDCAVCGGELFVADTNTPGELHVFGLDGAPRRTVRGDFYRPWKLESHEGRLYMLEEAAAGDEHACADEKRWAARRLIVLEPDGEVRQIMRLPAATCLQALCLCGEQIFLGDLETNKLFILRSC